MTTNMEVEQAAQDRGYGHGKTIGQLYDPLYSYSRGEKEAYYRGYTAGRVIRFDKDKP